MPTYIITSPEGKEYEVDAPEGASQEQALSYFKQNWKPENVPQKGADYAKTAEEQSFLTNLVAGAGGAATGIGLGTRQLAGYIVPSIAPTEQEVADYQAAMSGLRGTAGGVIGEVGTYMIPGAGMMRGAAAIPAIGGALARGGLSSVGALSGLGAAEGAVTGALAPVTEDQSRMENIASQAALGGIASPATAGLLSGLRTLGKGISPFISKAARERKAGEILTGVAGEQTPEVISALKASQPIVSGQTAGQAAAEVVSPEFAALQKVVSDINPQPALTKELAQKEARSKAIESFAKTNVELENAIKSRSADADANYARAFANRVSGDNQLRDVMNNPFVQDVIPDVRKLVKAKGGKASLTEQLHMIKKQLDAKLAGTPISKPSDDETRAIMDAQGKLINWLTDKNKFYAFAKNEYELASKPITEMKIGQRAKDILESEIGNKERAAALAKAVNEETSLLKKSGGFTKAELADQLKPENMAKLNNVIRELDVNSKFAEQASKGIKGEKLRSQIADVVEIPNMLNQAVTITNGLLRKTQGYAKIKTLKEMSTILQDPLKTAQIMEKATKRERNALRFLIKAQQAGAITATSINQGNLP